MLGGTDNTNPEKTMKNYEHIDTRLIHAGEPDPPIDGAVAMPIFQTAMFHTVEDADYHDIRYIRLNNTPNHHALHRKLAALEGADDALVTASGMAAISTALLTVLSPGDHLLVQNCLYGGTHSLITEDLAALGILVDFIDGTAPDTWEEKLTPTTRAIYVETISNPLMEVPDLGAVVRFANAHRLVSMVDSTFATPVNFRPAEAGFDLSLHSCTKYLNGHSDIVAGAVIGRADVVERVRHKLNHLGGTLDPHACFLLHRGIKTLGVRMARHNESALRIAQFLDSHGAVAKVAYPGLESSPHHARACEYLDGFGGMVSFEVQGGEAAAARVMERVRIPLIAPSLGGVESLLTRPVTTSHRGMPREVREAAGITDGLIRMSVGIESVDELIADLDAALSG